MEKLTGWSKADVAGKLLIGEIFGSFCRLRGPEALTKFMIVLHNAIEGQETDKFPFGFFNKEGRFIQALLTANTRRKIDGHVMGAFCFLQISGVDVNHAIEIQRLQEKKSYSRMKEMAYVCQEMKNPLSGIRFMNSLLRMTEMSEEQKQVMETSYLCEKQLEMVIKEADLESVEDG